ncbi:trehalose-6-phosphate synthase, partial [Micromonospora azadirachtae]
MRHSSLVVVANRLPIDDNAAPDGACEWRRSPGGLVSALHPLLRHTPATWVGW